MEFDLNHTPPEEEDDIPEAIQDEQHANINMEEDEGNDPDQEEDIDQHANINIDEDDGTGPDQEEEFIDPNNKVSVSLN